MVAAIFRCFSHWTLRLTAVDDSPNGRPPSLSFASTKMGSIRPIAREGLGSIPIAGKLDLGFHSLGR